MDSKKNYIKAAYLISTSPFSPLWKKRTAEMFAIYFSSNYRFDKEKFLKACGVIK